MRSMICYALMLSLFALPACSRGTNDNPPSSIIGETLFAAFTTNIGRAGEKSGPVGQSAVSVRVDWVKLAKSDQNQTSTLEVSGKSLFL